MRTLARLSAIIGACLCPQLTFAQTAEPVTLVLVTWVGTGTATAQTIIGTFGDVSKCVAAAQTMRVSNGATPLGINFICVPNK